MTKRQYRKYYTRILSYCALMRIRVKIKPVECEGTYCYAKRLLSLDDTLSESGDIATLLHELGHAFDFDDRYTREMNTAYGAMEDERTTKKQKALILKHEIQAWHYAKIIAGALGIKLGPWFYKEKRSALRDYRRL